MRRGVSGADHADARVARALFALALALIAALPLAHRFLPLVDWPQHLAQDAIVAHADDPAFGSAQHYRTTGWFLPYQGFRYAHVLVARAVGDDLLGGRLVLSLSLAGSALAILAITRALGRSPWLALVGCTVVIEANLLWGFAPYVLATTLSLAQLALVLRWLDEQKISKAKWRLPAVALLGVAMFFTHAQPTMIACVSVAALGLYARRRAVIDRGALARLALAMAPAAALVALYLVAGGWLSGQALDDEFRVPRKTVWAAPWSTLYWMKLSSGLDSLGQLPAIAYALALWAAWRAAQAGELNTVTDKQDPREGFARVIAAVIWALFLLLPAEFRGQSIAPRLASLALLSATWVLPWRAAPRADAHARWVSRYARARVVVAACALGSLAWAHHRFAQYDRALEPIGRATALLAPGQRVATLAYTTHAEGLRLPVLLHAGAYSLVFRGGMSSMGFTRTGVTYRPEVPRDALTVKELWAPSTHGWQLDPLRHGRFYDAVIVVRGERYPGHPFRGGDASGVRARRAFREGLFELWTIER